MRDDEPQLKKKVAAVTTRVADWVLWQDEDLIAVDKPAGIASQGGDGLASQNLVDLARAHWNSNRIAVLHRIDRNVSGVVLLAKTTRAARGMSALIADGALERRYVAVVKGKLSAARTFHHWLRKDARSNQVHAIDAPPTADETATPDGYKHSVTRAEPIAELPTLLGVCTTLHVWPITGRSHQIRVQLAAAGFPIVGDPKYGVEAKGLSRPLLHAASVRFTHPITREVIDVMAPKPWDDRAIALLRRRT